MTKITRFTMADMLVCPDSNLVKQGQNQVRLTPQEMAVLVVLANAAPLPVTRLTLVNQVWNDRIGAEQLVSRIIADLRKKLKDNARQPLYINTVIKKGYQLLPKVQFIETPQHSADFSPGFSLEKSAEQTRPYQSTKRHSLFSLGSGNLVYAILSMLIAVTMITG